MFNQTKSCYNLIGSFSGGAVEVVHGHEGQPRAAKGSQFVARCRNLQTAVCRFEDEH